MKFLMRRRKQRFWTPRSPEALIDSIIGKLKLQWGLENESDVITRLVIDAEKKLKL